MSEVPLIIDNGSGFIKGGRANMSEPEMVIPALVGVKKYKKLDSIYTDPNFKFGEDVKDYASLVRPQYMNTNGVISDYSHLKKLLDKIMYTCSYDLSETPVLITHNLYRDRGSRIKLTQIIFEEYGAHSMCMAHPSTLSLYSSGRTTGVVIDIGDTSSDFVPVYEGSTVETHAKNAPIGGRIIDETLVRLMSSNGIDINSQALKFAAVEIKEKHCYIALDPSQEKCDPQGYRYFNNLSKEDEYLHDERFKCTEVLFDPELYYSSDVCKGIHNNLYEIIKDIDPLIRDEMLQNIIATGGTTKFPGFVERLDKEFGQLLNDSEIKYKISMHENPSNSAWLGGAVIAGFPNYSDYFISREQYNNHGPYIIFNSYL